MRTDKRSLTELTELTGEARRAVEALERRPFHPEGLHLLGLACAEIEAYRLARSLLNRALRMAPGYLAARDALREVQQRERTRRQGGRRVERSPADGFPLAEARALARNRRPTLSACIVGPADSDDLGALAATLDGLADQIVSAEDENAARDLARGDWLLVLRSGERLADGGGPRLRAALRERRALWHSLVVEGPAGPCREIRLLRNAPGVRFDGAARPTPVDSLAPLARSWKLSGQDSGAVVRVERDEARTPAPGADDPASMLEQAAGALHDDDAERARELAAGARRRRAAESDCRAALEPAVQLECEALCRLGRYEELRRQLEDFHRSFSPTASSLFLEAQAARARGANGQAAERLQRAVESTTVGFAPPLPEVHGTALPTLLGALLLETGNLDEADRAFAIGLRRDPADLDARLGRLGLSLARGQVLEVVEGLQALAVEQGDRRRVWIAGDILLGRVPSLAGAALEWTEEAARRFPDDDEIRERHGRAHLRIGDGEAALSAWEPDDASVGSASRLAACLAAGREPAAVPGELSQQASEELLDWFRGWLTLGAIGALDRALCDIQQAESVLPGIAGRTADWLGEVGQDEAARRIRERL